MPWSIPVMAVVICILASLMLFGCKKSQVGIGQVSPQLSRLEWNLQTLVVAYTNNGHTNEKWDEAAVTALAEFAHVRARRFTADEDWASVISNNCQEAVYAGCDDPMVGYLYLRNVFRADNMHDYADAFCKEAQSMQRSFYPSIRKYYAWLRAGQQVRYAYGYGTNIPESVRNLGIWEKARLNLDEALAEGTMGPDEAYEACHEWLEIIQYSSSLLPNFNAMTAMRFPAAWNNVSVIQLLKGEAMIHTAWLARGSGYANTVTPDRMKAFDENLAVAEKALTKAWDLNPEDPRIAVQMMGVELGQGRGRDRLDLWFNRAMKLDTNNYAACYAKLFYLEPKWYGSVPDMLEFGRECVNNPNWGGHIPLILMDAHLSIQQQYVEDSEKTNYWHQIEVWVDLNNAFQRFFELNPKETGWYHNYAWYAFQAGQWSVFNNLVTKMGPVNYSYFGGQDKFEEMVAQAKKRAAR